jgi:hypothetical protein
MNPLVRTYQAAQVSDACALVVDAGEEILLRLRVRGEFGDPAARDHEQHGAREGGGAKRRPLH